MQRVETVPIIESAVLDLWNEGMIPENIANKLGYPLDRVQDTIEAPGPYISQEEQEGRQ